LTDSATLKTSLNTISPKTTTVIASAGANQNEADKVDGLVFNVKAEKDNVLINELAITATGTVNTIIAYFKAGNTPSATFTTPSSYTAVESDSDSNGSSSAIFSRENFPAGTTGTVTSTISVGTDARGILLSIKPSGASGVPAGGGAGGSTPSTAGTSGTAGTGGGGGGNFNAAATAGSGATGSYWTQTSNLATAGSGGGGGGSYNNPAGAGGLYGGGGGGTNNGTLGSGAQGIIVFTYSYNAASAAVGDYSVNTGFKTTDPNTNTTQDLGSRYLTKNYLLDVYPNIASSTGSRVAPGLWGWGDNRQYQLGLGNLGYYSSPVQVGALVNWKQLSLSSVAGFGIKTDGTMWSWGLNGVSANISGFLGQNIGAPTIYYSSPVQIGTLTTWKSVVGGYTKCHAIRSDGTLWAWGHNALGQLGLGNPGIYYSSPVQVGALTNWKQIGINVCNSSADFSLALRNDGALFAWGDNRYGELGINTLGTLYYSNPIQVGALTNWKQVAGGGGGANGGFYSLAVKTDGTLWGWGSNNFGQLGNNNTAYYSSPIQIGALTNWKFVTMNSQQGSFGIKTDGTLWSWGYNFGGSLGLGISSAVYYSSPVQVGALTNWKFLSVNQVGSCLAIKTDGTLWAWGNNQQGELGLNNTIYYSSPVQVGNLTTWKSAISTDGTSLAIQDGYI
jgi:alpha-tubulin suppressor-like RCC1 family protein